MESIIIGIAGGSGSGKSTFTNRVKKYFGDDITVIYHDNYYHRQDGIPSDGNGLLIHNFTKGTGQSDVHRMTIQNGKLVYGDTEQTFSMGDSEWDKFGEENPEATWTAISDKSKIEELQ